MTAPAPQGSFAGVVKIVRFNIAFYVASLLGIAGTFALLALHLLPRWLELAALCAAALAAYWTLSSLLVSWYVYDRAGVTRWNWLPAQLRATPRRWANIHAGLDESTSELVRLFPGTEGAVVDIYDAAEMTEPSIARARLMYPAFGPFLTGRSDALPLPSQDRDTIFLLFAAHEVRDAVRRTQLLREAARVLIPSGQLVLVEHLRDWKNFLAFGPGAFHFHSARLWQNSIHGAGLAIERQHPITPFVRCFVLRWAER
jgi:SAM-dependent methyltransferase